MMTGSHNTSEVLIALVSLLVGWGLLALAYEGHGAILTGAAISILAGAALRRGWLRPFADLVAWGTTVVVFLVVGWPVVQGLQAAVLTTAGIFAILAGLHAPMRRPVGGAGFLAGVAWWGGVAVLGGLVLWWPVVALDGQRIGVFDPTTSVGMVIRIVSMLALLSLAVLALAGLRKRGARRGPGNPRSSL